MATITATASSHPVSYDSGYNLRSDTSNLENAFTDSDSDTCAYLYIVNGGNSESYIFYNFDLNIPDGAVIDSVTCTVKGKLNSTGGTSTRQLQLYSGTTAKGTATSITSTSLQTLTLTPGTWTASELNNAKLRFYAKRNTSATTTSRHYDLYGATLTVSYTLTYYEVTASSSVQGITVSPATQTCVPNTSTANAIISIVGDIADNIVSDNGVDVTSSIVSVGTGSYTYTILAVNEDHAVVVSAQTPTGDKIYIKVNWQWEEAQDVKVKVNGTWQSVSKAYKKANGAWEEQDKSAMFDQDALYLKG